LTILFSSQIIEGNSWVQNLQIYSSTESMFDELLPSSLSLFQRLLFYAGEYLALTGEKLNGVEMVTCGLATHYSSSAV